MTSEIKKINCKEIHENLKEQWKKTGLDITDICDHRDEQKASEFAGKWEMLNDISTMLGQEVFTAFEFEASKCINDCDNCSWGCGIDDSEGDTSEQTMKDVLVGCLNMCERSTGTKYQQRAQLEEAETEKQFVEIGKEWIRSNKLEFTDMIEEYLANL